MNRRCRVILVLVLPTASVSNAAADDIDFTRDIRPILSNHCFACHGPDAHAREAGLDLSSAEGATAVRRDGQQAVVPGDRDSSRVWARITDHADPMPPSETRNPLTQAQKDLLGAWIEQGGAYAPHWAWVAPVEHSVPEVSSGWAEDDIDRFIEARLERERLGPAPDADRVTLIRRLSLDLTGIGPTPDEIDAFIGDPAPDALERVVDRLLASDRFGERMATFWLDLVRYADTVGYHGDQEHRIWPYRDWVIAAFNDNMPFDQFTVEQLAGDLLDAPTQDQLIATGYNRLLQTTHEGGAQLKEYRAIYMADRVRNLSAVWMGATVGCAQCHDHKYDPFTMEDFYALGAFFADIEDEEHLRNQYGGLNTSPTRRLPEMPLVTGESRAAEAVLQAHLDESQRALEAAEAELVTDHESGQADATAEVEDDQQAQAADDPLESLRQAVSQAESALQAERDARPRTLITERMDTPREVRILPRGNFLDESGPVVEPAVPVFMDVLDAQGRADRMHLAIWLTAPESEGGAGEYTARVLVNRLWALFMGNGLCPSLDDFGGQGQPPVHPELLDHLAVDLMARDWDLKAFIRRLVLTRTYRQSSRPDERVARADPANALFARQTRRRLPAEMVRDALLHASGLLVERQGGPPVKPSQPAGLYRHLNFPVRSYKASSDDGQWRRGVYMHWQRQFLHPMLKAFDAPSREECTVSRPTSNTPLSALAVLNDANATETARVLAQRIMLARSDTRARIAHGMRLTTGRWPEPEESRVLEAVLDRSVEYYTEHPDAAEAVLAVGMAPRDASLDAVRLAAWTEVARVLQNLHETMTRE